MAFCAAKLVIFFELLLCIQRNVQQPATEITSLPAVDLLIFLYSTFCSYFLDFIFAMSDYFSDDVSVFVVIKYSFGTVTGYVNLNI